MTSIVTGIAALMLGTGAAQAQDGDLVGTYEVDCTVNEVQVAVKASHTRMPDGVLYIDNFVLPLDCTGELTSRQVAQLEEDILRTCLGTSPGNCDIIANDVALIVQRDGGISPVDNLTIGEVVLEDPEGPERVRMSVDLADKAGATPFRALVSDDGRFVTGRKQLARQEVDGTTMNCTEWGAIGSFGRLVPGTNDASIEYRRSHNLFCLADDPVRPLEVTVEIRGVSRAQSMD